MLIRFIVRAYANSGSQSRRWWSEQAEVTVSSKIRIYDLAKELKIDTKRLIEEVRSAGVDVSVPSNAISKGLAESIRLKFFHPARQTFPKAKAIGNRAKKAKGPQRIQIVVIEPKKMPRGNQKERPSVCTCEISVP
jgi:hypothetical protein